LDEPRFTQPLMYDAIAKQQASIAKYTQTVLKEGVMSQVRILLTCITFRAKSVAWSKMLVAFWKMLTQTRSHTNPNKVTG
jgi:2-oxoglutarate dehydrogenase complex dehydrogenase (E1) component-like enzyme